MAVTHRAGGLDAMLLAFTAGLALLYTLIFRRCVQGGMGPLLAALVAVHEGLTEAQSAELNARLVFLLANQVGDARVLADCVAAAAAPWRER